MKRWRRSRLSNSLRAKYGMVGAGEQYDWLAMTVHRRELRNRQEGRNAGKFPAHPKALAVLLVLTTGTLAQTPPDNTDVPWSTA